MATKQAPMNNPVPGTATKTGHAALAIGIGHVDTIFFHGMGERERRLRAALA